MRVGTQGEIAFVPTLEDRWRRHAVTRRESLGRRAATPQNAIFPSFEGKSGY